MKRILLSVLCICSTALNAQTPDVALLGDVEVVDVHTSDVTLADADTLSDAGALDVEILDADIQPPDVANPDAGDIDCENRCEANTLLFCDAGQQARFDCAEVDAQCGELSPEWGFDCLLPLGAQCSAGYAEGLSACAGAASASTCCIEGVCGSPEGVSSCTEFANDDTRPPSELTGTPNEVDDNTQNCVGCSQSGALSFTLFPLALLLWRTRRKK